MCDGAWWGPMRGGGVLQQGQRWKPCSCRPHLLQGRARRLLGCFVTPCVSRHPPPPRPGPSPPGQVGPDDDVEDLKDAVMEDMQDIFSSVDKTGACMGHGGVGKARRDASGPKQMQAAPPRCVPQTLHVLL